MVFSSPVFLFLFLPLVFTWHWLVQETKFRNLLLLGASLFFYAWGEPAFVAIMLASITFNYGMGLAIAKIAKHGHKSAILTTAIFFNLAFLFYFKYANFFLNNFASILKHLGINGFVLGLTEVKLPIGISFFTFQAISYIIDVYRCQIKCQNNILNLGLYIALFPQLIAGPIVRYEDIEQQLQKRQINFEKFANGIQRFIIGLGKKMLIANTVAAPVDKIFALPSGELSFPLAWLAVSCYTLQIYFDFSGYSDMAVGLGKMFGFDFCENFRYPYISASIREFWRRWHISLSTWFRDYLFIPLGGSRISPVRTYFNLVLVFFLCGLWHGASWNFVVWGLFHGLFAIWERLGLLEPLEKRQWLSPLRHLYTLLVVMVGWVFFRADRLEDAGAFFQAMANLTSHSNHTAYYLGYYFNTEIWLAMGAGIMASVPILPYFRQFYHNFSRNCTEKTAVIGEIIIAISTTTSLAAIFLACAAKLAAGTYNPFIYFRF
ncbi:MAG TPA: MBOAT family protein [Oscillatoriaceae cyanobacterium M33_DOE_052]|uniref:MBOAT family protein n=1 Tax=Planktothricoides sp. SpSt-374 TaxID=2282167 RepID=A0A7C3VU38_9CYAN|nr:MBOAT family protein [Oscillatoriaceae cyanobacterium M33_DOE_052]